MPETQDQAFLNRCRLKMPVSNTATCRLFATAKHNEDKLSPCPDGSIKARALTARVSLVNWFFTNHDHLTRNQLASSSTMFIPPTTPSLMLPSSWAGWIWLLRCGKVVLEVWLLATETQLTVKYHRISQLYVIVRALTTSTGAMAVHLSFFCQMKRSVLHFDFALQLKFPCSPIYVFYGHRGDKRKAWRILPPAWGVYMCDHSSGSSWHRMMRSELCWIFFLPWLLKKKSQAKLKKKKKKPPSLFALSVTLNRHSPKNKGSKLKCSKCTFSTWYPKNGSPDACVSRVAVVFNRVLRICVAEISFFLYIHGAFSCEDSPDLCSEPKFMKTPLKKIVCSGAGRLRGRLQL